MSSAPLHIYAGQNAFHRLKNESFCPSLFSFFLGASGGPKWFVLAGLDRVIFPEFFKYYGGEIDLLGSSAGAFRNACFVQRDPLSAINRLATRYSNTVYSKKPTVDEITAKAKELLEYVIPSDSILEILANDSFHTNISVARCKGLMKSETRLVQLLGLVGSAYVNYLDRRKLSKYYERVIFSSPDSDLIIEDPYDIPTNHVTLGFSAVRDSLMASGAIPLVLSGVRDITGTPPGVFRDGGIIDYHFDLKLKSKNPYKTGLVLYPHFYPFAIPGWFDKRSKNRVPHRTSYDDVVMLVPSPEFVATLPYHKIPDRKDFETMDAKQRIGYWEYVIGESNRLGEYFMSLVGSDTVRDVVQPLPFALQD